MRLAAILACLALPVAAQTVEDATAAAAMQLQSAGEQLQAAEGRSDRVRALTATVRAYEAGISAMRDGLRRVNLREADLADDLSIRQAEIASLLGALSSLSRAPRPVVSAHSGGAVGTARAGMMLSDVSGGLQADAADLQADLAEVRRLQALREKALADLTSGWEGAQTARAALGQAISERTELPQRFEEDPVQTALLIANAQSLADFATRLAEAMPDPASVLAASAGLPLPVVGRISQDIDTDRPGISIKTANHALVQAPAGGTVLFQGPLLSFGTVVILEPIQDVLFVLAGMEQLYTQVGQTVSAGDPIGLMGGSMPDADGNFTQFMRNDGGLEEQTLYLEVRDGQTPVDPGAWFALD